MHTFPYRILIADDNHDTADSTADLLRLDGHEVRTVYDGRQALEAARTFRPHLVILDIQMPVMDGCAAACALRAESPHASAVMVAHTALTQPADLDRVRRAGFDRYLSKPSAPGALEALVTNCLVRLRSREGSSSPL